MIARSRPVIGVLDAYHADAIDRLRNDQNIDLIVQNGKIERSGFLEADALMVRSDTSLSGKEFAAFKNLKYVVKQGVGVDNIDLKAAAEAGVEVYNTPGLNSEAVAELALSIALCLARRVTEFDRGIRDGRAIVRSQMLGKSLFGKTLGIVGMGGIGYEFATKWVGAMNGEVAAYDPYYKGRPWETLLGPKAQRVETLEELLSTADVISLHIPLNNGTRNLISKAQFATMKDGTILINCARGGIVDEDALLEALSSGKLAGAGLDAMEIEPPSRQAYSTLLSHENVIITPHVGASTIENQSRSGAAVAEIVLDLVHGRRNGNRVA